MVISEWFSHVRYVVIRIFLTIWAAAKDARIVALYFNRNLMSFLISTFGAQRGFLPLPSPVLLISVLWEKETILPAEKDYENLGLTCLRVIDIAGGLFSFPIVASPPAPL